VQDLASVRAGLAAALAGIDGLRVYAQPPGTVNPPAAVILRRSTSFDVAFGDVDGYTFAVSVLVSYGTPEAAQVALDALTSGGAGSVRVALEADPTLGGIVDYVRAVSVGPDQITEVAGVQYLSADVTVEVG
jgi:hypothetical protein